MTKTLKEKEKLLINIMRVHIVLGTLSLMYAVGFESIDGLKGVMIVIISVISLSILFALNE